MRLARTGLLATVAAAVATGLLAAMAGAAGVDLVVDGGELPASGIAFVTGVFSLVGVVLAAALLRWAGRPADLFVRIAVGLTILSLVPPLLWAEGAATAVTLVVLHLVAAAVMIPALTRSLRPSALTTADRALPRAEDGATGHFLAVHRKEVPGQRDPARGSARSAFGPRSTQGRRTRPGRSGGARRGRRAG